MLVTAKQAAKEEEASQDGLDRRAFTKVRTATHFRSFMHHGPSLVGARRGGGTLVDLNGLGE